VLDRGVADLARLADRGVRPDAAVAQVRAGADDRRSAHGRALEPSAGLDHDASVDPRVDQLAVEPARSPPSTAPQCRELTPTAPRRQAT
jgi:hypothetical protein